MPAELASVRIRTYNIGFGDCFLLSFLYSDHDDQHVLIDFGTMALPRTTDDQKPHSTLDIAEHIEQTCDGQGLTAVVATHRHQDHIGGFAGNSGKVIERLEPRLVLQPWTEQPDLEVDATAPEAQAVTRLALGDDSLRSLLRQNGLLIEDDERDNDDFDSPRLRAGMERYRSQVRALDGDVEAVVFVGNNNIKNRAAIERLSRMGSKDTREYLWAGQPTSLESELPSVAVHVLGPPTIDQFGSITSQAHRHEEFWHSTNEPGVSGAAAAGDDDPSEDQARFATVDTPIEARWLARRLDVLKPHDLLAIARNMDNALNNTSLILLFELWSGDSRKLLLFPGDAQIENWQHFFDSDDFAEQRSMLSEVDVYKVGHHGSLNATPKASLWDVFDKTGEDGLVTLLSSSDGRHGHHENNTEVPRQTLVDALEHESRLVDTRRMTDTDQALYRDITIDRDGIAIEPNG